jgi:hypothetical protein
MRQVAEDHFVACHHPLVEVTAVTIGTVDESSTAVG